MINFQIKATKQTEKVNVSAKCNGIDPYHCGF